MNKNEAIKAAKAGAVCAWISAGITLVLVAITVYSDGATGFNNIVDVYSLIDVVLISALGFGIYRKSRFAAIAMFVYFLVSKIIITIETEQITGLGLGLVFLIFLGRAVVGCFVFHKREREENPEYKVSKLSYIIGIPSTLLFVAIMALVAMPLGGWMLPTHVQSGDEVDQNHLNQLVEGGVITAKDNIEYFYSFGLSSVLEGGNVLTQDRVILYTNEEKQGLQVYELWLDEITEVSLEQAGDWASESVYLVETKHPDRWIRLYLSPELDGDQTFILALRAKMNSVDS